MYTALTAGVLGLVAGLSSATKETREKVLANATLEQKHLAKDCLLCANFMKTHNAHIPQELQNHPAVKACEKIKSMPPAKLERILQKFLQSDLADREKLSALVKQCENKGGECYAQEICGNGLSPKESSGASIGADVEEKAAAKPKPSAPPYQEPTRKEMLIEEKRRAAAAALACKANQTVEECEKQDGCEYNTREGCRPSESATSSESSDVATQSVAPLPPPSNTSSASSASSESSRASSSALSESVVSRGTPIARPTMVPSEEEWLSVDFSWNSDDDVESQVTGYSM